MSAPATAPQRRTCYRSGRCTHEECRLESNRYQKATHARAASGRTNKVPAEVAKKVLAQRRKEAGNYSVNQLSKALGVSYQVITRLDKGTAKYIEAASFQRLKRPLALPPVSVPSAATALRLRMMQAEGWTVTDLVNALRCNTSLYSRTPTVLYETAVRVVEFVASAPEGSSRIARATARNKGWMPRSAYEHGILLDPQWDGVGGYAATYDELEDLLYESRSGATPATIAKRMKKPEAWVAGILESYRTGRG